MLVIVIDLKLEKFIDFTSVSVKKKYICVFVCRVNKLQVSTVYDYNAEWRNGIEIFTEII